MSSAAQHARCLLAVISLFMALLILISTSLYSSPIKISIYAGNRTVFNNYWPIKDFYFNLNQPSGLRSVYVTPRRVYFDNRILKNHASLNSMVQPRTESVIILAEVHGDALHEILACEVDGEYSESIEMYYDYETFQFAKKLKNWYRVTHLCVVVQCIGLSKKVIFNGSIAKLIYKRENESFYSRVESEKPLFITGYEANAGNPVKGKGSIIVCATMFGHPETFDHWLKYQEYIGINQVHLNVHSSFVENVSLVYPFFNKSLGNGFVKVETWNEVLYERSFYYNQFLKYQDCLYRHIGLFEYIMFCDYDDFFNPLVPNEKDIHFYVQTYFDSSDIGSVRIPWPRMPCQPKKELVKDMDIPHGNLTSVLSSYDTDLDYFTVGKSIYRLLSPWMIHIHYILEMRPGYREVKVGSDLAYIAHHRKFLSDPKRFNCSAI